MLFICYQRGNSKMGISLHTSWLQPPLESSLPLRFTTTIDKPQKQLEDQTVVPLLDRNESGCVAKLERFSNYVARQIGFEDGSECPQLCKLAYEYLKKSKECESTIYEYFADEPNVDELYVKLVEEFDRCILAYIAFHWSQASLMISQVYAYICVYKCFNRNVWY
ncbi:uncharacterized protein LOC114300780 [Camellia sinensis]|uniref:uncharacterized protein LOC114300780 n=1 Tax=Camellia sinensis TaxID=4442 RepID=UPI001035F068|nr:uncharacterized protein LOC114300780 [Camellia sinensis]